MGFSVKDPRPALFHVTTAILLVIGLGSVVIGANSVRDSRQRGETVDSLSVTLTAFGATAILASVVLFVAYVWSTYDDGNWLSKFVDKMRRVPEKFRHQKKRLRAKRRRHHYKQLAKDKQRIAKKLAKYSPTERRLYASIFEAAVRNADDASPEAVAVEVQALPPEQKAAVTALAEDLGKEAKEMAAKDVQKAEEQAVKKVEATTAKGKKIMLPPPLPSPQADFTYAYVSLPASAGRPAAAASEDS